MEIKYKHTYANMMFVKAQLGGSLLSLIFFFAVALFSYVSGSWKCSQQ